MSTPTKKPAKKPGDAEKVIADLRSRIQDIEADLDDLASVTGSTDDCDCDEAISPYEAVNRWLDRQTLLGISPEACATVQRLLEDLR